MHEYREKLKVKADQARTKPPSTYVFSALAGAVLSIPIVYVWVRRLKQTKRTFALI